MTANLKLVPFNLLDPVTLTITSEESGYEKERLAISQPSIGWRSTSAADQVITADLGEDRWIDSFCAVAHNFSGACDITLEVATDTGYSNLVVDETFDGALPLYGLGSGYLGLSGLGGYDDALYHQTLRPYFFTGGAGRYVRITISDNANADGYVEAGRLIVGAAWSPNVNHEWGIAKYVNPGARQFVRTPAAGGRSMPGEPFKVIRVSFSWLDEDEDFALQRILEAFGGHGGAVLVPYPDAATVRQTSYAVYGVLNNWSPSTRLRTGNYSAGFDVEEIK
jgi:hypothetical protein